MKIAQLGWVMVLCAAACSPATQLDAAHSPALVPVTTTVALNTGTISGNQRDDGLKEFLGIPYAALTK